MIMAEPENHTLRPLRDIRAAIKAMDGRFQAMDTKIDRNHQDLTERLDSLKRLAMGESVLGRYATAEFDERLEAIEKRVAALERSR
jgi:chaperonin cofactor prefoldin